MSLSVIKLTSEFTDGFTFSGENTYVVITPKEKEQEFLYKLEEAFETKKNNEELIDNATRKMNSYYKELFSNQKHTKKILIKRFQSYPIILKSIDELELENVDFNDPSSCLSLLKHLNHLKDNRTEEQVIEGTIDELGLREFQNITHVSIDDLTVKQY